MARPRRTGLDYFPFDCDFFEDEKMIAIGGEFGIKGELAAIKLLCAIYRNGYYIEWTEMLRLKMLQRLPGVSAELLDQIVNRLVRWGFFDIDLFGSVKVLTSVGIQRRYFSIVRGRVKQEKLPYILVSYEETPVSYEETPVSYEETPQIKVNKIKKISPDGDTKKTGGTMRSLDFGKKELKKIRRKGWKNPPTAIPQPTLEDVKSYFLSKDADTRLEDWETTCLRFFDYFTSADWRDKNNRQITRWDSRANLWIADEEARQKERKENEQTTTDRARSPSSGIPIRGRATPRCGLKRPDKR